MELKPLKLVKFKTHGDDRGLLTVAELNEYIDWSVKRIYYVTATKLARGGHAVAGEKKIYICVQGTMTARFHDGKQWTEYKMEGPDDAIIMEDYYFREFVDFSDGAVLLAVCSINYDADAYEYDLDSYINKVNQ